MAYTSVTLPYGEKNFRVKIPNNNMLGIIQPQPMMEGKPNEQHLLQQALTHPIGTPLLRNIVHKGQRIAIITSDITRPCPSAKLLPFIFEELHTAGVTNQNIIIILALGLHRSMTAQEIDQTIPPEIRQGITILNHNNEEVHYLGTTSRGTPVEFNKPVVEADVRICLGNLEFHWFAGYSGGAKAILPGCASKKTIHSNHALMIHPGVHSGQIQGNPLREDLEEAVSKLGIDFILNVLVDREHHILSAVAGDFISAHRKGCETVAKRGKFALPKKADIVIASAGGYPKDINLYQAHKGMEHASYFVEDGGILIFIAECREGMGNQTFESWMLSASTPTEILERLQSSFEIGGHKAAGIARIQKRANIYLVSNFSDPLVQQLFMHPYKEPQSALDAALDHMGKTSQILVLPQAGSTLPNFD